MKKFIRTSEMTSANLKRRKRMRLCRYGRQWHEEILRYKNSMVTRFL